MKVSLHSHALIAVLKMLLGLRDINCGSEQALLAATVLRNALEIQGLIMGVMPYSSYGLE